MIELLVVIGLLAILTSLLFPALFAHLEGARIRDAESQLRIFQAALARYRGELGDYPPSAGTGDNAGAETMLAHLLTREGGGPFLTEGVIAQWLGDADDDGRQELADPWGNPWVYFHPSDYPRGGVYYTVSGKRLQVEPVKKDRIYLNRTTYQLWTCGPNKADESGQGDDIGNVRR